jgi:prevent-host-death family protein
VKQVNIHDAKTHLSKLIEEVESGEEIVIARAGKPVAKLSGIPRSEGTQIGRLKGRFVIPDDFASPLPADLLESIEAFNKQVEEPTPDEAGE